MCAHYTKHPTNITYRIYGYKYLRISQCNILFNVWTWDKYTAQRLSTFALQIECAKILCLTYWYIAYFLFVRDLPPYSPTPFHQHSIFTFRSHSYNWANIVFTFCRIDTTFTCLISFAGFAQKCTFSLSHTQCIQIGGYRNLHDCHDICMIIGQGQGSSDTVYQKWLAV